MDILYVDQWIIVINKPAGVLSIPDGYDKNKPYVRKLLEDTYGRCWVVHRLDKETSGTLVLARSKEIHRDLSLLFETRKISKLYIALVYGEPQESDFSVSFPLRINADRHHRTRVDFNNGKPAITNLRVTDRFGTFSKVQVEPFTGYTHQIRSHLSYINHPILGDSLYLSLPQMEKTRNIPEVPRMALHSLSIRFTHPILGQEMIFDAPTPDFFKLN